ncbi:MAG: ATP-dependent DNA helicase RecG [Patescibacteria group bacterium]
MLTLDSSLSQVNGIGPATIKKLAKLELKTCFDLIWHLPSRYDDFSQIAPINSIKTGEKVTIRGKIQLIQNRRSWKRHLSITEALVSDSTGNLKCLWFNQPYLTQIIKNGQTILLSGILQQTNYGLQLEHPVYELISEQQLHTGRLVPSYPLTYGLTSRYLRQLIARALPLVKQIQDWLPEDILQKYQLIKLDQALTWIHFPNNIKQLTNASSRLAFNELFILRLRAKLMRQTYASKKSTSIIFSPATKKFVEQLPWQLTPDQRLISWQIIKDLEKHQPMNRLLHGDVGSGKTVVAGIAALNVVLAGGQVALLAPTEILAEQHFATLASLFKKWPMVLGLVTRSHKAVYSFATANRLVKTSSIVEIKKRLANNQINFLIGTHAILSADIKIPNLNLLIVDEQHRFGVEQRQALTITNTKTTPHFLSLSATPIPRSLALTIYGDLDISLLKQMPHGRKSIVTKIISPTERRLAYDLIKKEIKSGNRIFIICPLIDESDALGVRAATSEQQRLSRDIFPDIAIGLLHGKMSGKTKSEAMQNFKSGKIPILVATSVVEVGVDVPEATVMVIEGAERFGLAQLHQLRGRVGRSDRQSFCLLFTDSTSDKSNKRLQALVNFQSGFDLAEQDLKLRGPGDLIGLNQSGWLALKIASLANGELLEKVRQVTDDLLQTDPQLEKHPLIKQKIQAINFHPE